MGDILERAHRLYAESRHLGIPQANLKWVMSLDMYDALQKSSMVVMCIDYGRASLFGIPIEIFNTESYYCKTMALALKISEREDRT